MFFTQPALIPRIGKHWHKTTSSCTSQIIPALDVVKDREINLRKSYHQASVLTYMFWNPWVKECLPSLMQWNKWIDKRKTSQGGVVFIVEPNVARRMWQVGQLLRVSPHADGCVRTSKVKTNHGTYTCGKLCLLEECSLKWYSALTKTINWLNVL